MLNLLTLLALPLILLNLLGGLVGGVWLLVLGEWMAFTVGLLGGLVGSFVCGVAIAPGMAISASGVAIFVKGGLWRMPAIPLLAVGVSWTYAVICGWAFLAFRYFLGNADEASLYPMLLVGYSMTISPWAAMARSEGPDSAAYVTTFFLQIAALAPLLVILFGGREQAPVAIPLFLLVMALSFIFDIVRAICLLQSQHHR